jgi:hypothetical protein
MIVAGIEGVASFVLKVSGWEMAAISALLGLRDGG